MKKNLIACLLLAACTNELERPVPPDLTAVQEKYALVDGVLDERTAPALLEAAAMQLGLLRDAESVGDLLGLFLDSLDGIGEKRDGLEVRRQGLGAGEIEVDAGGWGVYRRRCPGWGAPDETEEARGKLEATVLFDEEGIEPTIWGALRDCRLGETLQLDGRLSLLLEGLDFSEEAAGLSTLLLTFQGEYSSEGIARRVAFDTMVTLGESAVTTIDLPEGGRFLVGVGFSDAAAVQVVDAGGVWTCDTQRCLGPQGEVRW